jgi:alkaline phosphatase
LASPTAAKKPGDTANNVWDVLKGNGYQVLKDRKSILDLMDNPKNKVVCINPVLPGSAAMPYAIDQPPENLSLEEMTEVAIENLYSDRPGRGQHRDRGFFIMVEGGKIDWACHANDAVATIGDMLDFDNAVGVALDFYRRHPHETLIVVTGDHETGGMTIGHATTAYKAHYNLLMGQTNSYEHFGMNQWAEYKTAHEGRCPADIDQEMIDLMETTFGLNYAELNDYQKEKLEDAYDMSLCDKNDNSDAENTFLYGGYDPIIVTITHILNENASIGWTSYSHTGVPVPVFAEGREAVRFAGFYDNTDIAKKLAKAMRLGSLPVEK